MVAKKSTEKRVERVPTGIRGLDSLMEGGIPKNSSVLVRGGTGCGKTILCLQYLYKGAIDYGDPGVFISFSESRNLLLQHGMQFGWDLQSLEKKNLFTIIKYAPHEMIKIMEEGGGTIRDAIESMGTKRLVIDSITAYEMFFESRYKANESVLDLFEFLREWNTTAFVTSEFPLPGHSDDFADRTGFLSDSIINLFYCRHKSFARQRALEVMKMRDTCQDSSMYSFVIGKDGILIKGRARNIEY